MAQDVNNGIIDNVSLETNKNEDVQDKTWPHKLMAMVGVKSAKRIMIGMVKINVHLEGE